MIALYTLELVRMGEARLLLVLTMNTQIGGLIQQQQAVQPLARGLLISPCHKVALVMEQTSLHLVGLLYMHQTKPITPM